MLKKLSNPYDVLSETISFENVQQIGEMITLKALRSLSQYPHACYQQLYLSYIQDLNHRNYPTHTFSDAYDLAQTAICFLCEFIGKELTDVYTVKNGKVITIKHAVYTLLGRYVHRICTYHKRACDIDNYTQELSVEIDHYQEKDYTAVDNKI